MLEGLAFAARDCYADMGDIPAEVRLAGGAARSEAMRSIFASVLNRPVRVVDREEAGAAGAAMIAAVQQGLYADMAACAADWVTPHLDKAQPPDPRARRSLRAAVPALCPVRAPCSRRSGPPLAVTCGEPGR